MAVSAVARAYEQFLLGFPNVVGVGTGKSDQEGLDEEFIRVYVSRKLPRDALSKGQVIPEWLEGYPVIVEEVGEIQALEADIRGPDLKGHATGNGAAEHPCDDHRARGKGPNRKSQAPNKLQ
jgi:hypothetical protein